MRRLVVIIFMSLLSVSCNLPTAEDMQEATDKARVQCEQIMINAQLQIEERIMANISSAQEIVAKRVIEIESSIDRQIDSKCLPKEEIETLLVDIIEEQWRHFQEDYDCVEKQTSDSSDQQQSE